MKILSISDVITNSSSEVFIIHGKPEFQDRINEEVPELLAKICNVLELDIDDILTTRISTETGIDDDWYYNFNKGDLIIESVSDNTIPYWLMEFIEDLYYFPKFRDMFSGYYAEDLGEVDRKRYDFNKGEMIYYKDNVRSIQREHLG